MGFSGLKVSSTTGTFQVLVLTHNHSKSVYYHLSQGCRTHFSQGPHRAQSDLKRVDLGNSRIFPFDLRQRSTS